MSGLHLHAVRDADDAAAWLVRELRTMAPGPFDRPIVLAEHAALQRHLMLAIAKAEGCVANVRLVKPAGWLHESVNLDGTQREWSVPSMTWALTHAIRDSITLLPAPAQRVLESGDAIVLHDLAGSIAKRFRAYLLYRPDLLIHWESSDAFITSDHENERWQRALWLTLVERAGVPSPTALIRAARAGTLAVAANAPSTLLMIGDPAVPPALRELLTAIAANRDVRWCVLQPHGIAELPRISERRHAARAELRARGLSALAPSESAATLLGTVQHQLRGAQPAHRDALDDSVTLHNCHSALREIETLRERAIKALEDNPTLRPHDITLYVTSLAEYLPAIDAVFGVDEEGIPKLPYSVAGKPFRENSAVILALTELLAVADGRATLDDIGALLALSPIARKANLTDDEVATALGLLTQAGVTWGHDAEERHARFDVPALDAGTWQHGIDRLVLGVATGRMDVPVNGMLPVSGDTAGGADLIGRLAAWTDALFAKCDALRSERSSAEWKSLLEETLRDFIAIDGPNDARAARTLRDTLGRLLDNIERVAPGTRISLGTIRAIIEQEFEDGTGATGQLRGGMRVCRLEPGAVLPNKVVLIAGVSDALHPGGGGSIAWDLLAKHPVPVGDGSNSLRARAEDPDARADALDTFREAVCSADAQLHLSWTGITLQKQEKRASSVAVAELRDLIAGLVPAQAKQIIIEEPPHPFSLRLFTPGENGAPHWTSAAKGWERAAKLMQAGTIRPRFMSEPLVADTSRVIALDALASAVQDPTKHFCERVVGLLMHTDDEELAQTEPQAIKVLKAKGGVDGYFREVAWRLERAQLRGDERTAKEIETWLRHQPELPYGEEGRIAAAQVANEWFPRLAQMRTYEWQEARSIEVSAGQFTITGRLDRLTPDLRVVASLYDVELYSALKHWVTHLVMNLLAHRGEALPRITLVDAQTPWHFTPVADPEPLLADLCALYSEASQGPVPLFRKSGIKWLEGRKRAASTEQVDPDVEAKSLGAAQGAWQGTLGNGGVKFAGECEHEHHRLCWPIRRLTDDRAVFNAFTAAADRVLLPMLQHEAKGAPK
jgi:exodeoxyribonuclease V gamma subunit